MPVMRRVSGMVGQETLRSSPTVSRNQRWIALGFFGFSRSAGFTGFATGFAAF
jgi:hypothetical protein